jgi:hypothetical protein
MRPRNRLARPLALLVTLLAACAPAPADPAPVSPTLMATSPPPSATLAPSLAPGLTPTATSTDAPAPTPAGALTRGPYLQSPASNSIVIVWETDRPMPGEVFYGLGGAYDQRAVSEATGRRHEVTLQGLEPGAVYGYWIASLGYPLAQAGSFRTAPPAGAASFTFAAFGDTRSGHDAHRRIADAVLGTLPDFALHTGDLVGYGSRASEWDRFFEIERGLMANVPLFPSPGNHEQNAARYFEAFVLPGNERWYTFEWGNARFVSLQIDAIVPFGKQSEQVQWLEATLAANTQPWLIVWFHLPPFDSYDKTDLSRAVRTNLLPLFERYRVDLVLSGHSHNYQRSNVNGITYLVTAGGGAELNPLRTAGPELEAGYSGNHFVRFQIDGAALTAQALTPDGEVVDEFTLSTVR